MPLNSGKMCQKSNGMMCIGEITNTIRSVENLKKVIALTKYQEKEIEITLETLKSHGKESLRITPYYATLMHSDQFHAKMWPGEKSKNA